MTDILICTFVFAFYTFAWWLGRGAPGWGDFPKTKL